MYVALLCAVLAAEQPAGEETATEEQLRFFETSVRPLLVEKCFKCHGEKKQWGSLRLDSRESLLKGGDSGAAVIPGKPDKSLLIQAVRHSDPEQRMPKNGKLTERQIDTLVRWVEVGTPFPTAAGPTRKLRDPDHWAFQPAFDPSVPVVNDRGWLQSKLDHFILAKIEAAGLTPAPRADKRTLIRRVTFDLIGMPPTPAEVNDFLADQSPDAFARLVDRLLASPRYGQRWGRHWLDVARYADSNGFDENVCHGNAWRYRDYVVDSFNDDKTFDRFVIEQLAGDLLPFETDSQRHAQLIATGFLSIGPKVLAETDLPKMRMDIIDEQLDTTGRAFLGLTFGCARCHDHKFDPISAKDYYGLAGIFKSTLTMRKYIKVAEWHEHALPGPEADAIQTAFNRNVAARKKTIAELVAAANSQAEEKLASQPETKRPEKLESLYPEETKTQLKKLRDKLAKLEKAGPDLPTAMGVTEDRIVDVAVHLRGDPLKLGDVVARRTPTVVRGPKVPKFTDRQSGRRQLAEWLVDSNNPLTARVFVNRIWRWHFGRGLVPSTDNFGLLGELPSHPELLDWLALRFIADGWSIKKLHRQILTSATWQQSSSASSETKAADPDNRLFSRAAVRRLEAEAVRDSLLAVSGQLDETMGGSLLTLKNRAYFFDHTSIDKTTYDSPRRSIYLPVVRNNVYDVFQLLDFPDPAVTTGNRSTTVVPSQALLMMNSPLVMEASRNLAERLQSKPLGDEDRLQRLYLIAFGRKPTGAELKADLEFLAVAAGSRNAATLDDPVSQAWAALCHVALAASEFIYVR